jgi:hypothetical protein
MPETFGVIGGSRTVDGAVGGAGGDGDSLFRFSPKNLFESGISPASREKSVSPRVEPPTPTVAVRATLKWAKKSETPEWRRGPRSPGRRDARDLENIIAVEQIKRKNIPPSYIPGIKPRDGTRFLNPCKIRVDTIFGVSQAAAVATGREVVAKRVGVPLCSIRANPQDKLNKLFFYDLYIEFSSPAHAVKAIEMLHGATVQDGFFPLILMYAWDRVV